jgi:hypothetical protein
LLLIVAVIPECAMAAKPGLLPAKIALRFDFEGNRFCYDRDPEIIYSEYDRASGIARVMLQSLDGSIRTIAKFPDVGGGADLACSQDGSTIAVLDAAKGNLYILRSSEMATYRFDNPLLYAVRGTYSLLSPDGSMLSVPGAPIHVAGPDILKHMRFFRADGPWDTFFDDDGVYVDKESRIDLYKYCGNNWQLHRTIAKPAGFGVQEVSRCGRHVIASLGSNQESRFLTLESPSPGRAEWLRKIGVTALFRQYNDLLEIDGGYGRCVFPLEGRFDDWHILKGLVTFNDEGMQRFVVSGPPLAVSGRVINLSKDGCYAILDAFNQVPAIPQFTFPHQTLVVGLAARGCKF